MNDIMQRFSKLCLLFLIALKSFGQVSPPVKPLPFSGNKRLNETDNKNGILSNAIYSDNVFTVDYKRYRIDSLGYIRDSLEYVRLLQIAPTKQNRKNKK